MHLRTLCLLVLIGLFFSASFAQENKPASNPSDETTSAKSNRDLKESVDLLTKEVKYLHEALDAAKISTSVYWVLVFLTLSLIVLWFGIQKTAGLASQDNLDKARSQLQQDMTQLPEKFNNHLQTSLNPVKADLQTNLQTVRKDISDARGDIQAALNAGKTEIQGALTIAKNDIQTALTVIRGEVGIAKNDIQTSVQAVRADVLAAKNSK